MEKKLCISVVTTSWYVTDEYLQAIKSRLEKAGFDVRIQTHGLPPHKGGEGSVNDVAFIQRELRKICLEKYSDRYKDSESFWRDYKGYKDAFARMKNGEKPISGDAEFIALGETKPFDIIKEYMENIYQKAMILKGEVEAAAKGEVDVIWPVAGGNGAPEMLQFMPGKLPENSAIIVGMSDVSAVQSALMRLTNGKMKAIQYTNAASLAAEEKIKSTLSSLAGILESRQKELKQEKDVISVQNIREEIQKLDNSYVRLQKQAEHMPRHNEVIEETFSLIRQMANNQPLDVDYNLSLINQERFAGDESGSVIKLEGGTINVLGRSIGSNWEIGLQPVSDTVIIEVNFGDNAKEGLRNAADPINFEKLFKGTKNIILGNVLVERDCAEFQMFMEQVNKHGIRLFDGLPFGHKNEPGNRPIPLNVPCILYPDNRKVGQYSLLIAPSKEKLQSVQGRLQPGLVKKYMAMLEEVGVNIEEKPETLWKGRINSGACPSEKSPCTFH